MYIAIAHVPKEIKFILNSNKYQHNIFVCLRVMLIALYFVHWKVVNLILFKYLSATVRLRNVPESFEKKNNRMFKTRMSKTVFQRMKFKIQQRTKRRDRKKSRRKYIF